MSDDRAPSVPGQHLAALRACRAHPEGLRRDAYPDVMPALAELGYVLERHVRSPGRSTPMWYLTPTGRDLLRALGPNGAGAG